MKVITLTFLLAFSAYVSGEAAVPFVVSIWKVEMVTSTTTGSSTVTTTGTEATTTAEATDPSDITSPSEATTASEENSPSEAPKEDLPAITSAAEVSSIGEEATSIGEEATSIDDEATTTIKSEEKLPEESVSAKIMNPGVHNAIRRLLEVNEDKMDHVNTPTCTGAIINAEYVLTTEACANATANDTGVYISAGVTRLDDDNITNFFHEVSSVIRNPPFALMKVKTKFTQTPITWTKTETAANSICFFTYWNTKKMIQHPFQPLTTVDCPTDDLGVRICAFNPSWKKDSTRLCDVGADGAVLICNNQLTAMWGGPFGCNDFFFSEVQQKKDWIDTTLRGGAGAVAVSFTALLGVILATTANLIR